MPRGRPLLSYTFISLFGYFDHSVFSNRRLPLRFFPRWKEWEEMQATNMQFTLDEDQWEQDWASVLSLASQPGASLEQTHVFALAQIIRRPIIIYGVKFVRSFHGETLGLARFQGMLGYSNSGVQFSWWLKVADESSNNRTSKMIVSLLGHRCVLASALGEKFLLEKSDRSRLHARTFFCTCCYGNRTAWCCRSRCSYRQ